MIPAVPHFSPGLFGFLRELSENNTREWFDANRERYRQVMQEPAIRFVLDFGGPLAEISPAFRADPRPVGGSIFRIHRDMRFVKEGGPYKTTLGIQFRHESAKDVHSPGFYLHLEPGSVFVAMGLWRPDGPTTRAVRERILEDSPGWIGVTRGEDFAARLTLEGDSLVRAPRGIDPEHPLVEDLRRKDFIAVAHLQEPDVLEPDFLGKVVERCEAGAPFMRWLCGALELPF